MESKKCSMRSRFEYEYFQIEKIPEAKAIEKTTAPSDTTLGGRNNHIIKSNKPQLTNVVTPNTTLYIFIPSPFLGLIP
jgi:hypothetical protein